MKLKDPLPGPVVWILRTIGWGLGGVAILVAWLIAGNMRLATHYTECFDKPMPTTNARPTAMQSAKALVACVEARTGLVEWLAFRPIRRLFSLLPSAPCPYAGTWQSTRGESVYRIRLEPDGQFLAEPVRTPDPDARRFTGSWSVLEKERAMVWLYDEGLTWPPDVNAMKDVAPDAFTLVERDGALTSFTRESAGTCAQVVP